MPMFLFLWFIHFNTVITYMKLSCKSFYSNKNSLFYGLRNKYNKQTVFKVLKPAHGMSNYSKVNKDFKQIPSEDEWEMSKEYSFALYLEIIYKYQYI